MSDDLKPLSGGELDDLEVEIPFALRKHGYEYLPGAALRIIAQARLYLEHRDKRTHHSAVTLTVHEMTKKENDELKAENARLRRDLAVLLPTETDKDKEIARLREALEKIEAKLKLEMYAGPGLQRTVTEVFGMVRAALGEGKEV